LALNFDDMGSIKNNIFSLLTLFAGFSLQAQSLSFQRQDDLLRPVAGFVNFADCLVDMNGDFLDDVIRVGEKGIFIDYQQPDGTFLQKQFNFSVQFLPSWSICAGDIDNNGYNDLLLADSDGVSFIVSNHDGSSYSELLMDVLVESQRSTMADINNDGWLDAFVCHDGAQSVPFRNDSGVMIPDYSLFPTPNHAGNYAAIWTDYDNDRYTDMYLSKCLAGAMPADSARINLLFRNNGDGFTEVGHQARVDDNAQSWSTAFEDFDNDGDFDAFVVNHDMANRFYRNNGDGTFTDIVSDTGIDPFDLGAFENSTGDFNNDGFIDIFSELTSEFYLGNGDLTFTAQDVPVTPGGTGDVNHDGFLDIVRDNQLWVNEGNQNHWVRINPVGYVSNRNGIGARVEIYGPWGRQLREIRSGQSFSPMSSLSVHFGLGTHEQIDSILIIWPSGIMTRAYDLSSDQTYIVPEVNCLNDRFSLGFSESPALCPGESISLPGPDGFVQYRWSNGDTSQSTTANSAGFYYLTAFDSSGCASVSDIVEINIIQDTPPGIAAVPGVRFCQGDSITLIATPGENHTWSSGQMATPTITVSQSGIYTVSIDANCILGQITSEPLNVISLDNEPPAVSDVYLFPGDSVLISATGDNIHWYDSAHAGTLLATGPLFQTPSLDMSENYYIESHHIYPATAQSGGKSDTTGGGGLAGQNGELLFQTWEPFTVQSVTVYVPEGGPKGVRFIQIISNDSVISTGPYNVVTGANILELNIDIPVGSHTITSPQGNLFRNQGALHFPYPIGDVGEITGSSNGDQYYYYFYDWRITTPEIICISERIPVTVIVSAENSVSAGEGLKLYPNPASGYFTITGLMNLHQMIIRDALGKVLKSEEIGQPSKMIDATSLKPGIYFIELQGDNYLIFERIIIQ
jgi:hypothetical protein